MVATMFMNFVCIYSATLLVILPVLASIQAGDGKAHLADETVAPIQHITGYDLASRLLKEHKHILLYVSSPMRHPEIQVIARAGAYGKPLGAEDGSAQTLRLIMNWMRQLAQNAYRMDLSTVQAIQDEAAETIPELAGIKAFASFLPAQMMQFGISGHPVLIYFREGVPVPYEGVSQTTRLQAQDVILWLMTAKTKTTISLNDDNFEHDTQASTGSTTGDWFVMFYDGSCDRLLPRWETLAVSLKGKKPVGRVDKATSPNLVQRLNIQKCPELILFRQGKMYHYELPKDDTKTLETFALSAYQNAKSGPVPKVPTPFDHAVEAAASFLKKHPVIFGLTSGALLLTLLVVLVVTSRPGPHDHED